MCPHIVVQKITVAIGRNSIKEVVKYKYYMNIYIKCGMGKLNVVSIKQDLICCKV